MDHRSCSSFFIVMVLLMLPCHANASESIQFTCASSVDERKDEAKRMRQLAAGIVSRPSPYELRIKAAGKTHVFRDDPTEDREPGVTYYVFCDRAHGFIFLKWVNPHSYSGLLIDEQTGAILDAGYHVMFSPDKRAYLAVEQQDGRDGTDLKVYFADGRLSWEGSDNILHPSDKTRIQARIGNIRWTQTGELVGEASCWNDWDRTWQVKLRKINGAWDWHPKPKCVSMPGSPPGSRHSHK